MKTKTKSILACLMIVPGVTFAATNCRVVEFVDHYEAICEGDEKSLPTREFRSSAPAKPHIVKPVESRTAAVSQVQGIPAVKPIPEAVKQLIKFRQQRLQPADLEAKRTIRMRNIIAGRQNEVVAPQTDNSMQNDMNTMPSVESPSIIDG
jgi:hypothetical protein